MPDKDRPYREIGAFFREARKAKGLSQEKLSELAQVSPRHITNIERGKINPSCTMMRRLINVLHVDVTPLFYEQSEAKTLLETELLDSFRKCDPVTQQKLIMVVKCFADE